MHESKMPIDRTIAYINLQESDRVKELNGPRHVVMERHEIKVYALCDRFYVKTIISGKNIFYSIGDILLFFSSIVLFTSIFFIMVYREKF